MICQKCGFHNIGPAKICSSCDESMAMDSFSRSAEISAISPVDAVKRAFLHYFTFSGRARRSEYWWFQVFAAVISAINALPTGNNAAIDMVQVFGILAGLVIIIPLLSLTSRRLHDIGKSGWWQLLFFGIWLPTLMGTWIFPAWAIFSPRAAESDVIGFSFLAAAVLCGIIAIATIVYWVIWMGRKGEPGLNQYGPNPR
jgi:uncharacterized membrane protein YhaH (DUF805 family)